MDINNSDFIVIEWKSEKKVMLRKIINDAWDIVVFEVSRDVIESNYIDTLKDDELKELKYHGIYFLLGIDANGDEKVYIGQGSIRKNGDGVFARVKEHTKQNAIGEPYFSVWDRAIIFASKYRVGEHFVAWDKSVISALESIMISVLPNSWNNKIESQSEQPLEAYSNTIKQIEVYSAFLGLKAFREDDHSYKPQTMTIAEYERYNKFESIGHCKSAVPDIRTPIRIVKSMLNLLPDEVWNDETVFFDPACKGGEFLREIFDRLMTLPQLVKKYPNITIRTLHILSKQLFGIALTEESRKRTVDLLSNGEFDFNIKTVDNYIQRLKNGEMREIIKEAFGRDMEFSVVIGNPPYNEDISNNIQKHGIYNLFIDAGTSVAKQYVSMIIPSRWMTTSSAGISKKWIEGFRTDRHIRKLIDYVDSTRVFSGVYIDGGVCYFLYDIKNEGTCERTIYTDDNVIELNGDLSKSGIVLRNDRAIQIIDKIIAIEGNDYTSVSFSSIVQGCTLFYRKGHKDDTGYDVMHTNWTGFSPIKTGSFTIKYYTNSRVDALGAGYGYVSMSQIPNGNKWVSKHKVYHHINYSEKKSHKGDIINKDTAIKVIDEPFYGEPNSCCSMTYRIIGTEHETKDSCNAIIAYMKTKFFRYLVSLVKAARNINTETFCLVPMQDFTPNSDIDWSKPIDDIDDQLYKKYGLTQSEIDYINSTISQMK